MFSSNLKKTSIALLVLVFVTSMSLFGCSSGGSKSSSSSVYVVPSSKSEEQSKTNEYISYKIKTSNPDDKGVSFSKNSKEMANSIIPELKSALGYVEPEKNAKPTELDNFFKELPKAIEGQTIKVTLDYNHTGKVTKELGEDLSNEIRNLLVSNPDIKFTLLNFNNTESSFKWSEDSNNQYTFTFSGEISENVTSSSSSSKTTRKEKEAEEAANKFSYSIHAEKDSNGNLVINYNDINNLALCNLYALNGIIFTEGSWFNKDAQTSFMNNVSAEDVNVLFNEDGEEVKEEPKQEESESSSSAEETQATEQEENSESEIEPEHAQE